MSTPIETNTEQLQEVLQQVYNLPNRSGGGSVTPDLVVVVDGISSDRCIFDLNSDDVSIESGSLENTIAKMANGGYANVLVKLTYIYWTNYYMQFVPENVLACINDDYADSLTINFGPLLHYGSLEQGSIIPHAEILLYTNGDKKLSLFKNKVFTEDNEYEVRQDKWEN